MNRLNKKGDAPTFLLFIVALVLCSTALFSMASFNENFESASEERNSIISNIDFFDNYIIAKNINAGSRVILEGGLLRSNEGLKSKFQEISEKENYDIVGLENYFGKVLRGEFDFRREGEKYIFEINDLNIEVKKNANSYKRKLNLRLEFDDKGEVLGIIGN